MNISKDKRGGLLLLRLLTAAVLLLGSISAVQAETVRFAHCLGGCPTGAPAGNQIIARSLYTLSFNTTNKIADWVAYIVTPGSIGVATNLSRQPLRDPFVDDTLQPEDFETPEQGGQIGLSAFAPLVSFAGTPFWSEINYLTNMVPRNSELNRGSWYGLEWAVRNLANRTNSLYVITGPVYTTELAAAEPDSIESIAFPVPTGFFKVIVDNAGRVGAFIFPQDLPFHVHHCDRAASLDEVERLTGLDLFPELPGLPAGDLAQGLGCFPR
jgi:endonuclease G